MVCVEMTAFFFCQRRTKSPARDTPAICRLPSGLDRKVFAVLQRTGHGHGHFLLLRANSKFLARDKMPVGEKISSTCEIKSAPMGWFSTTDIIALDRRVLKITFSAAVWPGAREILFCFTLPDSTQTMCLCSAGSKSSGNFCVVTDSRRRWSWSRISQRESSV